ncbi:glutamate--cysteine ligase [Ruixingdingia sedimenti]|uniref:Glutamate--cysteine ligase n=1 Tax=Ruixingdingia sedimenti TaxID=3073604 RepID=A0ABU1F9A4_9RHOB|nr:glutamate--cysteine ligase [Xinfangfangia sp. LG-4]MDR5653457.1 glutamate--cysteine ligase [Xinfangfangia sp. LG-4]
MSIPQSGGGPIEHFDQLAEYIASGCKPAADWRIGTEHEKFGFLADTLAPLPYDGPRSVRAVLEGLRDRFGWTPVLEQGHIIGLTRNGANVSLEPGGQLELSGAMLDDIHTTRAEIDSHLAEVRAVADPLGVRFMGLGAAPIWRHEDMPVMPKGRYRLMTDYMGRVGTHGTQMMYRTCTVQVNLDYASEADMVKKLRVALALQPVATALFANSPFFEGRPNGHRSWRSRIWRGLDDSRTGMLPFVFEPGFGFERYVDYVLDVPMYFVYRDGHYIDALGQSFRDFLAGRLPALPGEVPTLSDWADHMTTVFPEARVKKYIEMRGADGGAADHMTALSALWVGLVYDTTALDAAWDIAKGWDTATREGLRVAASEQGLAGVVDGIALRDLAARVLEVAETGLKARARTGAGGDETGYLDVLRERVASGKTAADRLLDHYHGDWQGDLTRIYDACAY